MAAWAAKADKLAWVTNRKGPYEIWVRSADGVERPVVTAAEFPDGMNRWFMNPALSPDGDRLIFTRIDNNGVHRLWMISLLGGSPVRLTNEEADAEYGGAWSPDGSRFAYLRVLSGKTSLMTIKTSGNAAPFELGLTKDDVPCLPDWSPAGDWITWHDNKGWSLICPDGKTTKFLGQIATSHLAFSKDGKLLYGIQLGETAADRERTTLFSLDPVTLRQNMIKELDKDLRPFSGFRPSIRFSLGAGWEERYLLHSKIQIGPLDAAGVPPARLVEPLLQRAEIAQVKESQLLVVPRIGSLLKVESILFLQTPQDLFATLISPPNRYARSLTRTTTSVPACQSLRVDAGCIYTQFGIENSDIMLVHHFR